MKASRWNPAGILVYALLAITVASLGLLSLGRFDLSPQTFGSMMAVSRIAFSIAALGVLYRVVRLQVALKPRRVHARQ